MRGRDVIAGVEHAGRHRHRLGEFTDLRGRHLRQAVMADRHQLAVALRAQPEALDGAGTVAVGGEHLLARHFQPHGPIDAPRGHRREGRRWPGVALRAKAAAHERANDRHVLLGEPKQAGDRFARAGDALRRGPDGQPVACPVGEGGVRLHRIVMLDRGLISRVDADRGVCQGTVGIAGTRIRLGLAVAEILRLVGAVEHGVHHGHRLRRLITHRDFRRGRPRLARCLGDHQADMLAIVKHFVVL